MANALKEKYHYDNTLREPQMNAAEWMEPMSEEVPKAKPTEFVESKKVRQQKADRSLFIQLSICAIIIFTSAMSYVHSHYTLTAKQMTLNSLKAEKVALTNQITNLEAQITQKLDLKVIKEKAVDELNMQSPLAHQIVYINVASDNETNY